jgi:hypothetical protein
MTSEAYSPYNVPKLYNIVAVTAASVRLTLLLIGFVIVGHI